MHTISLSEAMANELRKVNEQLRADAAVRYGLSPVISVTDAAKAVTQSCETTGTITDTCHRTILTTDAASSSICCKPPQEDNEIHINIKKKKFNFNFND